MESDEQQPSKSSNSKLDVKLSWLPPPYTSPSNPILAYTVSLGPPINETATASNHKNILSAAFFRMNRNHNVPGVRKASKHYAERRLIRLGLNSCFYTAKQAA